MKKIELMGLVLSNGEMRITSIDTVDIINTFRKIESENGGKEYKELLHRDFMRKIRKELEVLESVGLGGGRNISLTEYKDKQGKTRPCYSLNRDGMLMMLNSESVIVRYKTIEYINKLEEELMRRNQTENTPRVYYRTKRWEEIQDKSPLFDGIFKEEWVEKYGEGLVYKNNCVIKDIRDYMEITKTTQTHISKYLNISHSVFSKWMNGNAMCKNNDLLDKMIKELQGLNKIYIKCKEAISDGEKDFERLPDNN